MLQMLAWDSRWDQFELLLTFYAVYMEINVCTLDDRTQFFSMLKKNLKQLVIVLLWEKVPKMGSVWHIETDNNCSDVLLKFLIVQSP